MIALGIIDFVGILYSKCIYFIYTHRTKTYLASYNALFCRSTNMIWPYNYLKRALSVNVLQCRRVRPNNKAVDGS